LIGIIVLAALLGCSSTITMTENPSGDEAILESFGRRYAGARCELSAKCQSIAKHLRDACPAQHDFTDLLPLVRAGLTTVDSDAAEACLKAIESLSCQEWDTLADSIPNTFPACAQVFQGHVIPGEPCHADAECSDGVCVLDNACPGVCRAKRKPGDACSDQDCGYSDHVCTADGTCKAKGQAGDPCFRDGFADCVFGLECSTDESGISGPTSICVERQPKGASCVHAQCAHGLFCIGSVCTDGVAEGNACTDAYSCADGLVCAGLMLTSFEGGPVTPGTCRHPNEIGGACTEFRGALTVTGCATGLECVGGACAMPPTIGPCGPSAGCAPGNYCNPELRCVPQDPDGTACIGGIANQCAGGGCRNGLCASPCAP
jgi:hypothetical protein